MTVAPAAGRPGEGEFRGRRVCLRPWLWEPSFKAGEGSAFIQEQARGGADPGMQRGCAPRSRTLWGGGAGPNEDLTRVSISGHPPSPERAGAGGGGPRWGHLQPHTWRRLERTWLQLRGFSFVKPLNRLEKTLPNEGGRVPGALGLPFPQTARFGGARGSPRVAVAPPGLRQCCSPVSQSCGLWPRHPGQSQAGHRDSRTSHPVKPRTCVSTSHVNLSHTQTTLLFEPQSSVWWNAGSVHPFPP